MSNNSTNIPEDGVDVSYEQINPDTLRNMIEEFVTREWSSLADDGFSLDDKVEQVLKQLKEGKAKIVFDIISETANIVKTS